MADTAKVRLIEYKKESCYIFNVNGKDEMRIKHSHPMANDLVNMVVERWIKMGYKITVTTANLCMLAAREMK